MIMTDESKDVFIGKNCELKCFKIRLIFNHEGNGFRINTAKIHKCIKRFYL